MEACSGQACRRSPPDPDKARRGRGQTGSGPDRVGDCLIGPCTGVPSSGSRSEQDCMRQTLHRLSSGIAPEARLRDHNCRSSFKLGDARESWGSSHSANLRLLNDGAIATSKSPFDFEPNHSLRKWPEILSSTRSNRMAVAASRFGFEHAPDGLCCRFAFSSAEPGKLGMIECMRALVIAKDSPTTQKLKQLLGQSSFDCLQADDWIEAIRWSTDESLDLIVTELNSTVWNGDRVFELVERGAFGKTPPPMIVLASEVGNSGSTDRFSTVTRIATLAPSFGRSDLACALETLFSENDPRGQQCDSVGQWQFLARPGRARSSGAFGSFDRRSRADEGAGTGNLRRA